MAKNLIHAFLENSAAQHPEKVAVIHGDRHFTYRWLNSRADHFSSHMRRNGITKGDRVALLLDNGIDYVVAYYATLKAGAVIAPLNPGLKPDGLQRLLVDLEPAAVITSFKYERLLKAVDIACLSIRLIVIRTPRQKWDRGHVQVSTFDEAEAPQHQPALSTDVHSNDLASIIYTSGSTGEPKGVMLSHKNIVSNTQSICQYLEISHRDIQMIVLPFFYVMGKSLLNTHIAAGGTVIINNRFMYPADVVNQMISEQATSFSGVPSTYAYLLHRSPLERYREQLGALRYCSQAGGHMAASLKSTLRRILPEHTQLVIMYGATEASARLTYLDPHFFLSKLKSIGKPIPGVSIRIIGEEGKEITDGKEGELVAAGPNIMMGYWKNVNDTARVVDERGYHTGDIGYRDRDGFLFITRRKDGLIKVGGHRVNPIEVEDYFMATEMFVEASVAGLPDKLLGNKLFALVVPKYDDFLTEGLMEKCATGLPKHKIPAKIISVRALPKNANGKIDNEKCKEIIQKKIDESHLAVK